ncbi:MAG: hypothetical protein WA061_01960 [Microgenomates group bacterium]
MKIYQVEKDNQQEYEDYSRDTILITEDSKLVAKKIQEVLEDEDYFPGNYWGGKDIYIISIWENGKDSEIFRVRSNEKVKAFEFVDTL